MKPDINYLTDNRGDPNVRAVLDDYEQTTGKSSRALAGMYLVSAYANAYADAYADAYANANANANADADANANAYAYADADAYAYALNAQMCAMLTKELLMTEGLVILKLPGYYGPVRIGWLRRVCGDDYQLLSGSRALTRTSGERLLEHLAWDGPQDDHKVWPVAKGPSDINRFRVWAVWPANEAAWKDHCPRPADWPKDEP